MWLKTLIWDARMGIWDQVDTDTNDITKRIVKTPENYKELLEILRQESVAHE